VIKSLRLLEEKAFVVARDQRRLKLRFVSSTPSAFGNAYRELTQAETGMADDPDRALHREKNR
jgi:hypothetical protein